MRPVPPPYLPIPMAAVGRGPALPQDLLLWGWLRLREGAGPAPTPLPAKAYIARCLKTGRDTVAAALDRLTRTDPPLLVLYDGRQPDGRHGPCYRTSVPQESRADAARRSFPPPRAGESDAARRNIPHDVTEPQTNTKKEKETDDRAASLSLYPALFRKGLNDEQQRIVRAAFPFGCSPAQLRRLMQAAATAERQGCTPSFIAYAVRVTMGGDDAPWDALARQVRFLKTDLHNLREEFGTDIAGIASLRDWLDAHRGDPTVKAYIRGFPGTRERCNALLRWRRDL